MISQIIHGIYLMSRLNIRREMQKQTKPSVSLPTANSLGKKVRSHINRVMFSITFKSVTNFAFCIKH